MYIKTCVCACLCVCVLMLQSWRYRPIKSRAYTYRCVCVWEREREHLLYQYKDQWYARDDKMINDTQEMKRKASSTRSFRIDKARARKRERERERKKEKIGRKSALVIPQLQTDRYPTYVTGVPLFLWDRPTVHNGWRARGPRTRDLRPYRTPQMGPCLRQNIIANMVCIHWCINIYTI